MRFEVLSVSASPPDDGVDGAFLLPDATSDWGKFKTQYALVVHDASGHHHIGDVKIGQFDMNSERPQLPASFTELGDDFFSLGQDSSYYTRLNELGAHVRRSVLSSLRDMAANETLFNEALNHTVMVESLLRSVTTATVLGQFRRLAHGGKRLISYKFKYTGAAHSQAAVRPVELYFDVDPNACPPANIHVLIGPNGVGKTHILEHMARALLKRPGDTEQFGTFETFGEITDHETFANIVSVTFSAFDPFEPIAERRGHVDSMRYSYVGLKNTSRSASSGGLKNLDLLTGDFTRSLEQCVSSSRAERWRDAVVTLDTDPIFKASRASLLLEQFLDDTCPPTNWSGAVDELVEVATNIFLNLSTGHKIVLLTLTRLVETVEERTLVLFDEPESHLHPPLLAAFIRALSSLLAGRNGVALLATHSPIVLQEVPMNCVWKLQRYGQSVLAERPESETFGENLGVLTREVFSLEVRHSGFHRMLQAAVNEGGDYPSIVARFGDKLGAEARVLVRTLIAARNSQGQIQK